jgi:hypothetical protein
MLAIAMGAVSVLTGCMTGERPTFSDTPAVIGAFTGDAPVDGVLTLFDSVVDAEFTAEYTITPAMGTPTTATVTQIAPGGRSVTIGDVRFVTDETGSRTCQLSTGTCENGLLAQRVSDSAITPDFAFGDMAKRLRIDANRNIGDTSTTIVDVLGNPATCVDVPVSGGTKQYCSLLDGVVSSFVGGDVTVTMTSYVAQGDPLLMSA